MTVSELIAELQKMPPSLPVKVEAYKPDGPDGPGVGAACTPNHVEGLHNEIVGDYAVIWALVDEPVSD